MTNIVLLGGNGYIGSNVVKYWRQKDTTAQFYIVSRSGKSEISGENIHNIRADATNFEQTDEKLPKDITYIADLIGGSEKHPDQFKKLNELPAETMLKIAKKHHVKAMGFLGASLGDKKLINSKQNIIKRLTSSDIPLAVVSPTLVFSNGHKDKIAAALDVVGIFLKKYKPVTVTEVAGDFVNKIVKAGHKRTSLL
ncbi:NAD-dependent epimerase/dehydratase family protein [Lactobacillus sp.]|uniref:NAD-dependent epimerase/dehydratase family protein n=1 Tax=Lactobacillus sp. TaxID=1591 RepID=UPI0019A452F6|nr:NAD-dependent epimerase/dehydratase family protein [Lactobacillus sp.]MBD5429225.1 NAD-dependent epimerase/dehydratase family protein [Lactobacillus sp.]